MVAMNIANGYYRRVLVLTKTPTPHLRNPKIKNSMLNLSLREKFHSRLSEEGCTGGDKPDFKAVCARGLKGGTQTSIVKEDGNMRQ